MKNLANIAILAITALTFEACSSTRATSSGNSTGSGTTTTTGSDSTSTGSGSGSGSNGSTTGGTTSSGTGTTDTMTSTVPDDTKQFIQEAAISGLSEVQLSQLALKNVQNSAVKTFAAMMVKDHGGANAELKTLAASKGITLPDSSSLTDPASYANTATNAGTGGNQNTSSGASTGSATTNNNSANSDKSSRGVSMGPAEKIERLRSSSKKEFDQNYVQLMARDHVKAVSLFEQGSRSTDPQVKAYATKHLPTLKMHLQQVTALGKTIVSQSAGN